MNLECAFLTSPSWTHTNTNSRGDCAHRQWRIYACESGRSRRKKIHSHRLTNKYPAPCPETIDLAPRHFINLTNGIEALPDLSQCLSDDQVRFTRIQSSHCESGAYNKLLTQVDHELLFSLACGRHCYIYDFGSRNKTCGVPRALFLGVEFIKWSIAYLWFGSEKPEMVPNRAFVRGKNLVSFWENEVMPYKIEKDTKQKIRYFSSFAKELGVQSVNLHGVYGKLSDIDGCKELHVKMVREWLEPQETARDSKLDSASWIASCGFALYDSDSTVEQLTETRRWITSVTISKTQNSPN